MNRLTDKKIVLVTRPTRLAELVIRFNTVSQARFYIEHQGADFSDYLREDETYHRALRDTKEILDHIGRVQTVDRGFLSNFVFAPEDSVVTLGQDGLVANTLKYLDGQPVVGVNPDPERWDGRLLPFRVGDLKKLMPEVVLGNRPAKSVTMAKAALNNGQTIYGVNDLFIGPKTHCSARYLIRSGEASETQSSSGVIVSTGLGSTGWLKSLLTGAATITQSALPILAQQAARSPSAIADPNRKGNSRARVNVKTEFAWDADYLFYTVREPFPTKTTGASLVFGRVTPEIPLIVESRMAENGVIFSDGIEKDFLEFNSGAKAVIGIAEKKGLLIE
ncbi:MAG TPA: sugar kinase [Verrucomicrobiae bacterium]|jgi:NAD kinase|nr:sugar kinase [Verrucomicrobiae bacterium]